MGCERVLSKEVLLNHYLNLFIEVCISTVTMPLNFTFRQFYDGRNSTLAIHLKKEPNITVKKGLALIFLISFAT